MSTGSKHFLLATKKEENDISKVTRTKIRNNVMKNQNPSMQQRETPKGSKKN